jgi:NodT family efflux transporter outer membrane factor (OMF) lipoprotein
MPFLSSRSIASRHAPPEDRPGRRCVRAGFAVLLSAGIAAGCTVGPDFKRPEPPATPSYTTEPVPPSTAETAIAGGGSQRFVVGQELQRQWWTMFHSDALDQLMAAALRDSPTVAQGQATLRQAQEALAAERGAQWPSVDASGQVSRQRESAAQLNLPQGHTFSLYNATVSVSYVFDLFGGVRRQLESLEAQVDSEQFQLEATYLALTANLATTAIREASLHAQLAATREIEELQRKQLSVVERRFALGAVARSDVLAQRTVLAQTHAGIPPLERQLALARNQLAILAGRFPSDAGLPEFDLDHLELPLELPVSVPSALARQRPDILAAEALLHSASAQVGVATADLYPKLTLTGSAGLTAFRTENLFKESAFGWSIGAGLVAPLFHGGTLQARRRAAIAAYDGASAAYRQTVLVAFGAVADALRALDTDARALQAQVDAQAQARASYELADKQFSAGAVSYLSLLDAQARLQQTRIAVVQAQADRYTDTVALFAALGGGWWNEGGTAVSRE